MPEELTDDEARILEQTLRTLSVALPKQLKMSQQGGKTVELDQQSVGRLSRIDAIAQQSVNQAGLQRLRLRLARVSAALRRMEDDEYGNCVLCEEPIGFPRLSVAPEVTTCVTCQERRENT